MWKNMGKTNIAGAVLGGPVGFVLGVAAGDWLGNRVIKAATTESLTTEMTWTPTPWNASSPLNAGAQCRAGHQPIV